MIIILGDGQFDLEAALTSLAARVGVRITCERHSRDVADDHAWTQLRKLISAGRFHCVAVIFPCRSFTQLHRGVEGRDRYGRRALRRALDPVDADLDRLETLFTVRLVDGLRLLLAKSIPWLLIKPSSPVGCIDCCLVQGVFSGVMFR